MSLGSFKVEKCSSICWVVCLLFRLASSYCAVFFFVLAASVHLIKNVVSGSHSLLLWLWQKRGSLSEWSVHFQEWRIPIQHACDQLSVISLLQVPTLSYSANKYFCFYCLAHVRGEALSAYALWMLFGSQYPKWFLQRILLLLKFLILNM